MAFAIKKPVSDGRINTFGIRLIDTRMWVIEDAELASRFKDFGYQVAETSLKPGEYDEALFDRAPEKSPPVKRRSRRKTEL